MTVRRWRGPAVVMGLLALSLAVAAGALWLLRIVWQPPARIGPAEHPATGGERTETLDARDRNALQRILDEKGAGGRR